MADDIANIYDEIEIEDMELEEGIMYYPCPCGDRFQINLVSEGILNRIELAKRR
jgi:hypothetical protein